MEGRRRRKRNKCWEEGPSIEKTPLSHWPVGKSVGHVLD